MDMEYRGIDNTEYILPRVVNILSVDDIIIECNFRDITKWVDVFWVCLYSEEKLQSMERNLKVETLPSGVKRIHHRR